MAVVKIDGKGRMTIPKVLGLKETRAIIIPAGSFFVVVPIPKEPLEVARQWLSSDRDRRDLKELAEDAAMEDALKRAEKRKQAL